MNASCCILEESQSAVGRLQWACVVIKPGHPFLRRMINATMYVKNPYHRIKLTTGIKRDLSLWVLFFKNFNRKTMFYMEPGIQMLVT